MNYNEDLIWINQDIYKYKDLYYGSDGVLELSASCYTKDEINFSSPKFRLSITNNNKRRICSLDLKNMFELRRIILKTASKLSEIYQNPQTGDITKKINQKQDLIFEFRLSEHTKECLVVIKISYGNSDQGVVIIDLNTFSFLSKQIEKFYDSFYSISKNLISKYLQSEQLKTSRLLLNSIKILPSQISVLPETTQKINQDEELNIDTTNIDEFSKFVEDEQDNIVIPELESTPLEQNEPEIQEFKSEFLDKLLKNDISVFEQLINSLYPTVNPLMGFISTLKRSISPANIDYLPGISDIDFKSINYLSTIILKMYIKSYLETSQQIPSTVQIIKYKPKDHLINEHHINLAYDLIMISTYLKAFRSKVESVNSDVHENKSILFIATRLITDVLSISFIENQNHDVIKNCIMSRFKTYDKRNFFKEYNTILERNRCSRITEYQIIEICNLMCNKVFGKQDNIKELHNNAFAANLVVIPPENDLDLEQITNEIIPIELQVKFGGDVNLLTKDDSIKLLFNMRQSIKSVPSKKSKINNTERKPNLLKWIKFNLIEVPERHQTPLLDHIKELENNNFDFTKNIIPIEELGEKIVKGLYTWNELLDKCIPYKDYAVKIEECISKDLIISKIRSLDKIEETEGNDWTEFMDLV